MNNTEPLKVGEFEQCCDVFVDELLQHLKPAIKRWAMEHVETINDLMNKARSQNNG